MRPMRPRVITRSGEKPTSAQTSGADEQRGALGVLDAPTSWAPPRRARRSARSSTTVATTMPSPPEGRSASTPTSVAVAELAASSTSSSTG